MTNNEMINQMIKMQIELDKAIYTEYGVKYDREKCKMAIFDEFGEMVHELKGDWCWWKKTQKQVDKQKVLEELVDVWHFAMSCHYHNFIGEVDYSQKAYDTEGPIKMCGVFDLMLLCLRNVTSDGWEEDLIYLFHLTKKLGYTMEDVYTAYMIKNKENYNRLASGY